MQKISWFTLFLLQIQSILEPSPKRPHPFLTMLTPKIFNSFNLCESVPACKNSVVSICLFLRYSKFQSPETRLDTPIFDYALPKIIDQILIFLTLYQHKKAETVLSIFSGEIIDLKSCNMIGWEHLVYTRFFYKQHCFSTQPQCCLAFSWIQLQTLLRSCLLHITIIVLRHILYLVQSCPWLDLVLFMLYLCDLFFIFSLICITINHIISLKLTHPKNLDQHLRIFINMQKNQAISFTCSGNTLD